MGVEKLIDGEVPNVMKNRGEEGKWKNKRKQKGEERGKHHTNLRLFSNSCILSYVLGESDSDKRI